MKFSSLLVLTVLLLASCGQSVNKILKNPDPKYKLRMAEQYFANKKYAQAQQIYEDIMPNFRGTPEFEDIYYKYAYTAYYQGDYLNAENLFKTYLETFPNNGKAEEIDYMRAYSYYKQSPKVQLDQSNTEKAIGLLQTFINTHPGSTRNKDATTIIDELRHKLELKDYKSAQLYYDIGQFRAAAVAFNSVLDTYPESEKADEYKYMAIKSYFRFAEMSVEEKKSERYQKVIDEANDFMDRFGQSPLTKDVQQYISQSQNNLKLYTNEPAKTST